MGLDMPTKIAQTDSAGHDVTFSQEWLLIRATILEQLEGFPDVKARLVEALGKIERIEPVPSETEG